MRFARSTALAALAAVVVAACASSGSATGSLAGKKLVSETGKRAITIDAVDNNFEPPYVKVSKGTTVTFKNAGHNRHNVISVGNGFKSSGILDPGDSWKATFTGGGDFRYYCSLHGTPSSGMVGGIRVTG